MIGRLWSTLTPAEREALPVGTVMRWETHGTHGRFARIQGGGWCRVENPLDTFDVDGDNNGTGIRFAADNVIEFVPEVRAAYDPTHRRCGRVIGRPETTAAEVERKVDDEHYGRMCPRCYGDLDDVDAVERVIAPPPEAPPPETPTTILAADPYNEGDPICLNDETGDRWELVQHAGTFYHYVHKCHPRVRSRMEIRFDTARESA